MFKSGDKIIAIRDSLNNSKDFYCYVKGDIFTYIEDAYYINEIHVEESNRTFIKENFCLKKIYEFNNNMKDLLK